MRLGFFALAAALSLAPLGARAQLALQAPDTAERGPPACEAWNGGALARGNGWRLKRASDAERWAIISYYDERVGPRADPKSDEVLIASHPDWPLVRVVILRGDCIVDIGQMGREVLREILRKAGTPARFIPRRLERAFSRGLRSSSQQRRQRHDQSQLRLLQDRRGADPLLQAL
jgi:hypothetical protein